MSLQEALVDLAPSSTVEQQEAAAPVATVRIQLWDLPLRIFHWSLLASVATAIVTGKLGGAWMPLHGKAGITIVGLLAFRLVWGLIGPTPARFAHFAPTPEKIWSYLQGQWQGIGHNPLGALSVFALLGLLGFQAGSGLFSNDDIAFTGPLASLVADELSHDLTNWHRQAVNILFVLIGLHVAAIAFYARVKKDKLVKPMVTGWKDIPAHLPPPRRARRIALVAALAFGVGAAYGASGLWVKRETPQAAPVKTATSSNPAKAAAPAW
jgi:cytochrome b